MKYGALGRAAGVILVPMILLTAPPVMAHHAISAKFDPATPMELTGTVALVDWRNPHVHILIRVPGTSGTREWAIELESPIDLERSGWSRESVRPGDVVTVDGIAARDGSAQVWANSIWMTDTGGRMLEVKPFLPPLVTEVRPVPRWPNGQPRLGPPPGGAGYWAHPSATSLVETGVEVEMDVYGLLGNIADAGRVAPFQPWARSLYETRQRNFLRDDPLFLQCKPPGGPRQYQLPYGFQLVEDQALQRIFVLIGGGNRNFRLIYTDGRTNEGQIGGDDDNPLYYGRSTGRWEGDTFVVETTGFNESFWFSNGGHPHTDRLHMIERFTRRDFDTLEYDVTIDDPGAYTRPWSSNWTLRWVAGEELPIHLCAENRP